MTWVRIDDHFYDHAKWATAPGDSIALWLAAMAWCNRNESWEGFIPSSKLTGLVNIRNPKRTASDLCARRAFVKHGDGYLIHEYADYQQNDRVRQIRDARSAAGRKGARVRWGKDGTEIANPIANAIADEWQQSWQTDGNENAPETTTHNPLLQKTTDDSTFSMRNGQSSSVEQMLDLAARAIVRKQKKQTRTGKPYRDGIVANLLEEQAGPIKSLISEGANELEIAIALSGSEHHAKLALQERDGTS